MSKFQYEITYMENNSNYNFNIRAYFCACYYINISEYASVIFSHSPKSEKQVKDESDFWAFSVLMEF